MLTQQNLEIEVDEFSIELRTRHGAPRRGRPDLSTGVDDVSRRAHAVDRRSPEPVSAHDRADAAHEFFDLEAKVR